MYTTAKVAEILDNETVLVACDTSSCAGCKASLFCGNKNHTTYEARLGVGNVALEIDSGTPVVQKGDVASARDSGEPFRQEPESGDPNAKESFVASVSEKTQEEPIRPNDMVRLYLPPGKTVLSTALVFALPLILFPVGYCIAKFFMGLGEMSSAFSGFALMGVSFFVANFVAVRNRRRLMPVIVGVERGKN